MDHTIKSGARSFRTSGAVALTGLLLIALNLRPALSSLSPLLETIRADLGLGYTSLSLLTTVPILCMGVFPITAMYLAARIGEERGLVVAVALIGVAVALRAGGENAPLLFVTSFLAGVGIAAAQALVPPVIKRHFARHAAFVMALYSTAMTIGAGVAAGLAVPMARGLGGWPASLAAWAIPVLPALALWLPMARRQGAAGPASVRGLPWRSPIAWLVTIFSGAVFSLFWSVLTWLAPAFREQGVAAETTGLLLVLLTGVQVVSSLVIAALASRSPDRRPWLALCLVIGAIGFGGFALVPAAAPPWAWTVLIGIGIGAIFPLALVLPLDFAADAGEVGRLSTMALSVGYLFAAFGPFVMGWLRTLTGGFATPFLALAILCCIMLLLAIRLRPSRARRHESRPSGPR